MFLSNYKNKILEMSLSRLSYKKFVLLLLVLFFFIYSFFSSNVPQKIDFQHYLITFFILSIFILILLNTVNIFSLSFLKQNTLFFIIISVFIYGVFLGFQNNNNIKNIIRDLISISSILVIFITSYLSQKDNKLLKFLFKLLVFTGLIFSIKVLIFKVFFHDYTNYPHGNVLQVSKYYFLYLENTIICSLIYFSLKVFDKIRKKNLYKFLIYLFLLYFPIFVVNDYLLRGPIIFSSFVVFIYVLSTKKPINILFFLIFLVFFFKTFFAIIFFIFYYFLINKNYRLFQYSFIFFVFLFLLEHIFVYEYFGSNYTHRFSEINALYSKFINTGLNHRVKEFNIFFDTINFANTTTTVNEWGLGSLIYNPIIDSHVLFVHHFILFYTYKMGVVGLIFSIFLILLLLKKTIIFTMNFDQLKTDDKYIYLSLLGTLLYPLFFSATYKSVTFGFLIAIYISLKINKDYGKSI